MTGRSECRYYGRDFTAEEMALLRALIAADPQPTRAALSREFCRRIRWFKSDGGLKDMMANRILATLDAIDSDSRLLSRPLRGDISMPPDGHALQPVQSPALDHIHFSARRIDPHAKTGEIMVPEDGVLVLDGERVDSTFGNSQIASSGHRGRPPTQIP